MAYRLSPRLPTRPARRALASGPPLTPSTWVSLPNLLSLVIVMLMCLSGMPVTLIGEAVFARCLSSLKSERVKASKVIGGPQEEPFKGDKQQFIDDLEQALYASKIISCAIPIIAVVVITLADRASCRYSQGFMLMREAAKEYSWNLNNAGIALMWRGGEYGCFVAIFDRCLWTS
jgi:6-phosphogluconate dehydrogenase